MNPNSIISEGKSSWELIEVVGYLAKLRDRREKQADATKDWFRRNLPENEFKSLHLLKWLDENTTGRIYLVPQVIAFESEQDAVIFALSYTTEDQ